MRRDSEFQLLGIHIGIAGQPVSLGHRAADIAMVGIFLVVFPRIVPMITSGLYF